MGGESGHALPKRRDGGSGRNGRGWGEGEEEEGDDGGARKGGNEQLEGGIVAFVLDRILSAHSMDSHTSTT